MEQAEAFQVEGDNDDQEDAEVNDGGIDFIADPENNFEKLPDEESQTFMVEQK